MTVSRRPVLPMAGGVLGGSVDARTGRGRTETRIDGVAGLEVVHRGSRFRGVVVGFEGDAVRLRAPSSSERLFRLTPEAFIVGARVVTLVRPRVTAPLSRTATASGSIGAPAVIRARTARASRIWVEGIHDAALVEKVWGDDLREVGVVVEPLDGIDDLVAAVRSFGPASHRRLGVLVDHLVGGSKESRLTARVGGPFVVVRGIPFVDVWQAVRPRCIGLDAWPTVPKGEPWKEGICRRLGAGDPPTFWRRLLGSVRTYADLEPSFVGAVEALIDHVTDEPDA